MMAKILIIDDTKLMRAVLKNIFISSGFEVVAEGGDGTDAVRLYKMYKPDLVMMDIIMPEMDGISALLEIKRFDPKAKVIMCSVMGHKNSVIAAIIAGAKDFIVKPFHKERVLETIKKVLS